jgi:AraC-like DNA-binding protein
MNDISGIVITWRSALMLAVCMPVLMSALLLFWQKFETKAAVYLGLFLLAAVIKVIPQIIGFAGFYSVWPGLTFAPFNLELLFGPLLLFHAHQLVYSKPLGQLKWLLLPGCLQVIYYLWAFLFLGDYKRKWAYDSSFHVPYILPIEALAGVVLFILCWVKIYQLSREYEKYLENNQSTVADFKPVWIQRMLVASLILLLLFIIVQIVPVFITDMSYVEEYPLIVVMMLILSWVGFEALRKLHHTFPKITAIKTTPGHQPTPNHSWQDEAKQLEFRMIQNQWFLEPRFSLSDLAAAVGSNETYVSRTINQGLGLSFNQYINQLRVAYAQKLLQQPKSSILSSALHSGFNSKATFNRVFKEQLGITPSQYKNSVKTSQIT